MKIHSVQDRRSLEGGLVDRAPRGGALPYDPDNSSKNTQNSLFTLIIILLFWGLYNMKHYRSHKRGRRFTKRRFHKKRRFTRTRGGLKKYRKMPLYSTLKYPFPDIAYLKCSAVIDYSANGSLAGGTVNLLTFSGNHPNQPAIQPGTGAICSGYGLYSPYFTKVTCMSSKIVVMFQNETASTGDIQVTVFPVVDGTLNPSWAYINNLLEVRRARQKTLSQYQSNVNNRKWFRNYAATHDLFGVTRSEVKNNPIYSSPPGGGAPVVPWY